jgi:hypothetical protein
VRETAPFILITHDALDATVRQALAHIRQQNLVALPPRVIRIERT